MTLNEYQQLAKRTANGFQHQKQLFGSFGGIIYCIIGVANEFGEVLGSFKKFIRGDKKWVNRWELVKFTMAKELGDVLWYLTMLIDQLGYSLEDIARMNIEKLELRQKNGTIEGDGDDR